MGFSEIATQLLFFIAVVGLSAGVLSVFSDYLGQTMGAMSDKQHHITSQLKTDIKITNIDNSSGHLHIYVKNIGNEQLNTDCVEIYVDSQWVTVAAARRTDPATGSQMTTLLPEETLKLNPAAAPLNSGTTHEAKVVTCNGVSDTEDF
jgi:archaellum component FlaG (FlaF/FlaG flagellin family)